MVVTHGDTIGTNALIDSGSSDVTYVPLYIAKYIGLNTTNMVTSLSASGKFPVYTTKLKSLRIIKNRHTSFDTFRDIVVRIPHETVRDLPFVVLGRGTIFKRYDITFSEKRKKIILSHTKK